MESKPSLSSVKSWADMMDEEDCEILVTKSTVPKKDTEKYDNWAEVITGKKSELEKLQEEMDIQSKELIKLREMVTKVSISSKDNVINPNFEGEQRKCKIEDCNNTFWYSFKIEKDLKTRYAEQGKTYYPRKVCTDCRHGNNNNKTS